MLVRGLVVLSGHNGVQVRERQVADLRAAQAGDGRDRGLLQRRIHHGRQHSAALQGELGADPASTPTHARVLYDFPPCAPARPRPN